MAPVGEHCSLSSLVSRPTADEGHARRGWNCTCLGARLSAAPLALNNARVGAGAAIPCAEGLLRLGPAPCQVTLLLQSVHYACNPHP